MATKQHQSLVDYVRFLPNQTRREILTDLLDHEAYTIDPLTDYDYWDVCIKARNAISERLNKTERTA